MKCCVAAQAARAFPHMSVEQWRPLGTGNPDRVEGHGMAGGQNGMGEQNRDLVVGGWIMPHREQD